MAWPERTGNTCSLNIAADRCRVLRGIGHIPGPCGNSRIPGLQPGRCWRSAARVSLGRAGQAVHASVGLHARDSRCQNSGNPHCLCRCWPGIVPFPSAHRSLTRMARCLRRPAAEQRGTVHRSVAAAELRLPNPDPRLHGILLPGLGVPRRPARFQRCLDPLDLLSPRLSQPPGLLLLLTGRRQAGRWWCRLDRRGVSQPGNGLAQRQAGIQPGGAPALGIAPALRHAGGENPLGLEDLSRIQVKADATAGCQSDVGD